MLHFLYHSIFLFHDTVFLSFPATCMGYLPIKLLKMEAMFFFIIYYYFIYETQFIMTWINLSKS